MSTLKKLLAAAFKTPVQRKPDPHRQARDEARKLAAAAGIEIERMKHGGFNVWPPARLAVPDPYEGDHYVNEWDEVLTNVRAYVNLLEGHP